MHTEQARTFVKGLRTEHPRVSTQRREQAINPHVAGIAAPLRWQTETAGWNLLGFEVIDGRPVDYSPGSADLPTLRDTLGRLGQIPCPELSPGNVLITETSTHLGASVLAPHPSLPA